jgi:hypothetical protein
LRTDLLFIKIGKANPGSFGFVGFRQEPDKKEGYCHGIKGRIAGWEDGFFKSKNFNPYGRSQDNE